MSDFFQAFIQIFFNIYEILKTLFGFILVVFNQLTPFLKLLEMIVSGLAYIIGNIVFGIGNLIAFISGSFVMLFKSGETFLLKTLELFSAPFILINKILKYIIIAITYTLATIGKIIAFTAYNNKDDDFLFNQ